MDLCAAPASWKPPTLPSVARMGRHGAASSSTWPTSYLDAGAAGKFDELEATYFGGDGGTEGGGEEGEGDGGDEGESESEGGTSSASRSGIIVSATIVVFATLLI